MQSSWFCCLFSLCINFWLQLYLKSMHWGTAYPLCPSVNVLLYLTFSFVFLTWGELFFGNISIFEYGLLSDTNETIIERWPPIIALVFYWPGNVILVIHWLSWMLSDLIFRLSRNMRELSSLDSAVCCPVEPRDQVSQYYNETDTR